MVGEFGLCLILKTLSKNSQNKSKNFPAGMKVMKIRYLWYHRSTMRWDEQAFCRLALYEILSVNLVWINQSLIRSRAKITSHVWLARMVSTGYSRIRQKLTSTTHLKPLKCQDDDKGSKRWSWEAFNWTETIYGSTWICHRSLCTRFFNLAHFGLHILVLCMYISRFIWC